MALPSGCPKPASETLQEEYEPTEGEDQITLSETFQQNKLEDVKVNVSKWITFLIRQRVKLQVLNHAIDDEYLVTHILSGLPKEYVSVVHHAKIDQRTSSLSLSELRKRLKENYRQLMKTNEWTHEEMSLKVQVSRKKPKKSGEAITNKRNKPFTNTVNDLKEDIIIVENMATKSHIVGNFTENTTQSQNKKKKRITGFYQVQNPSGLLLIRIVLNNYIICINPHILLNILSKAT